jgi:hypothetical protein
MRIGIALVVLALAGPAWPQDPRPTTQQLPPPQPPPELVQPSAPLIKGELPKPRGKQCIKQRVAPCTSDPKRECKVMEIAEC